MTDFNIEQEISTSRDAYNSLFSQAESAVSELKATAASLYSISVTQEGFDNNPSWSITRGREAASPGADEINYTPPEFNFDGDLTNMFQAMGLDRYSYQSAFFDDFLEERIRDWIDSQAYFLAQDVQDALFEQLYERDRRAEADALAAVNRQQAQRGFPMPTDMLMVARNDVIVRAMGARLDRNKEVTALIADKSLQEKLEAVRSGVQMEDIRSRFQLEYNKLYWQSADYVIRKYDLLLRSELAKLDADLKQFEIGFRADEFNAKQDYDYAALEQQKQVQRLQTSINEMSENVRTWLQEATMRVKAAEAAVNFYSSAALGTSGQINIVGQGGSSS